MNLLHVADHTYPDRTGGSEVVIYETCRRLVERGHDVSIVAMRTDGRPPEETFHGIKIFRFDVKDIKKAATLAPFSVGEAFRRAVAYRSPEVIHFHHTPSALGVNTRPVPKSVRKKVYSYYGPISQEFEVERHDRSGGLSFSDRLKSKAYLMAERYNLSRCGHIVALSEYTVRQIKELHGSAYRKAVLIHGGVDSERFDLASHEERQKIRKRLGLPQGASIILTVRRLVKRMGIDMLLEAFSTVAKEDKRAYLVIGGTGPERESLQAQAKRLGIEERTEFKGYIPDELLPLYYRTADLFVLPTRALEGFGLVTLEAMSSGTPVLGTAVGATEELIGSFDERFLIKDISPKGIGEKINSLLKDMPYLENVRNDCRDYVLKHYSWDRMAEELERFYENP